MSERKTSNRKAAPKKATGRTEPRLLSGVNPQIPKGEGDGPVQDYIAALPGWKRELGRRLDRLIVRTVPEVRKAVKWNQPFYGADEEGWFLAFREDDDLDEGQLVSWIEQASRLPGEKM